MTEDAYITQVARAGGPDALMAALENHLSSAQWADPKLVPGMDTWLNEERWRQRLDPPAASRSEGRGRTGAPPAGKYDSIEES